MNNETLKISEPMAENPLLYAVSSVGNLSDKERYIKTINLAVKQMKSELSLMEEIELSICTELNRIACVRGGYKNENHGRLC